MTCSRFVELNSRVWEEGEPNPIPPSPDVIPRCRPHGQSHVRSQYGDRGSSIGSAGVGRRVGAATYPPLAAISAGDTATERKTRSTEPRATAPHSLEEFQPVHLHDNLIITLGVSRPTLRGKVADVNNGSEPTKPLGSDFRRRRRVKVHTEVWSLRKSVCPCAMQPEHLVSCTKI